MKKILIIGATSSIAENCGKIWAKRGCEIFLVGRNKDKLLDICVDLKTKGAIQTHNFIIDLNNIGYHHKMLDTAEIALKQIDIVLIAHGTLPSQKSCEQNVDEALLEIKTNALSTISLLTLIANRFEKKKRGIIAVISSVAGDRGRANNYVYGSAKAMITTFLSGLRQRLHKSNIAVITIKPGFVDTPMTSKFKKNILWEKSEIVAAKIIKAIDQRNDEVYVPWYWFMIMTIVKIIPIKFFKRIRF